MFRRVLCNRCIFTMSNTIREGVALTFYRRKNTLLAQYSASEQESILKALNNFGESLSNIKISKSQHNAINSYLKERKQFNSLDEVLNLNGIGPRLLQRICNGVLNGGDGESIHDTTVKTMCDKNQTVKASLRSNFITPRLTENQKQNIKSVTGIEIGNFYISWVRLDCESKTVTDWEQVEFIGTGEARSLVNVHEFVVNLQHVIPVSDIYVLENKNWSIKSAQTNLLHHIRAAQTTAIFLTLLNNRRNDEDLIGLSDRVYFLKSYLPTRYFRTLIGQERVSPQKMVEDMFNGTFPDHCSRVLIEEHCKDVYFSNDKSIREALCQAFLLSITFMDIALLSKIDQLKPVKQKT